MILQSRSFDRSIAVSFIMFVVLGLPDGVLGLAWPSMREEFTLRQDSIGMFLIAAVTGFVLTSSLSGKLVEYLDVGRLLILASLLRGGGAILFIVAPSWETAIALAFLMSLGTGLIDPGVNAYVAQYNSTRIMSWLHAAYGVGATISPIVMTIILSSGLSWRWGYVFVGIVQLSMIALILYTLTSWQSFAPATGASATTETNSMRSVLRLPVVWVGILLFMSIAGLELTAGNWSFSLFTESREINARIAGYVISGYWGSLTVSRFIFGVLGDRWQTIMVRRGLIIAIALGATLVAGNINHELTFLGLFIVGFSLAPLFPMLIQDTAARMTRQRANNIIGLQVAAAGLGIAILPSLGGVLVERTNLETITTLFVVISILMFLLHEILTWINNVRWQVRADATPIPAVTRPEL